MALAVHGVAVSAVSYQHRALFVDCHAPRGRVSMPAKKVPIARTFAPIHFEDLDPHRFEDLIRELIYDFRDWQSIEATGRSGSDAGFDIRAKKPIDRSLTRNAKKMMNHRIRWTEIYG